MKNSARKIYRLKLFLKKSKDDLVDCAVTVNGTWQKLYGHNSKLGAIFVLSADTGEVLDYVIMSTYRNECQYHQNDDIDSKKYKNWKGNHNCGINHHGSADVMEKDSVVEMFCICIFLYIFSYVLFLYNI